VAVPAVVDAVCICGFAAAGDFHGLATAPLARIRSAVSFDSVDIHISIYCSRCTGRDSVGQRFHVNPHLMTLDISMARLHASRGQSYGLDIVRIDACGLTAMPLSGNPLPVSFGGRYLVRNDRVQAL